MLRSRSRPGLINRTSVAVAAPFSPLDLSPALWLDASDAATITQVANAVSQWNDKSGNGRHATQGTGANQPTTNTRTINSLNVIDFDGASDFMSLPSGLFSIPNSANTVIAVLQSDTATVTQRIFSGTVGAGTRWAHIHNNNALNNDFSWLNNTSFAQVSKSVTNDTNLHISASRYSSPTLQGYFDGAPVTSGSGANVTVDALILGAGISGASAWFDGRLAELIIIGRSVTNAELNKLGSYAASKWGATWATV